MPLTEAELARARDAWPGVRVPDADFAAWVDARRGDAPDAHPRADGEDGLALEDLYLACACARGDAKALEAFEAAFAGEMLGWAARFPDLRGRQEDVRQMVYEKLFVGERPRIADYLGRGTLRSWLRVTFTRVLLNETRREGRDVPVSDELFLALPEPTTPEAQHIKRTYGSALRAAFASAVADLGYRDHNMLRYALVEGLGIDEIAKIYSVHRATAARWLGDAKDALAKELRRTMKEQLGIDDAELASIVRAMESELDITVSRHLAKR